MTLEDDADRLNELLDSVADSFALRFHAHVTLEVEGGTFTYRRDNKGYGFFCGDAPINSTSLRLRVLLAHNIENMRTACAEAEAALHGDLQSAVAELERFLTESR